VKWRLAFIAVLLLAASAPAADPAPAEAPESAPKRKLGGGFKGKPVAAPEAPKEKAAAPAEKGTTPSRIVINNALVKKSVPAGSGKSEAPAGRPSAAPPPSPPPPVEMPKIVDLQGHDESYWRAKAAATRDAVARGQAAVAAAEAEEKREENDFYAWDDGQYRDNVIKPAWDRAREETIKARQGLEEARKQLDQLEDDARKAGAYPGWIRE
jgi:hypothetical protein